jgi:hypothetical protein
MKSVKIRTASRDLLISPYWRRKNRILRHHLAHCAQAEHCNGSGTSDQRDGGVGPALPLVPFVEPDWPPDRELVPLLAVSDIA